MYTLLFLMTMLCVLTVLLIDRFGRRSHALWAVSLVAAVAAFAPQVLEHTFRLAF